MVTLYMKDIKRNNNGDENQTKAKIIDFETVIDFVIFGVIYN